MDAIGGFPYARPDCFGCGQPLTIENAWMTDGCPCNGHLGINNMNETRWRLLMELQQRQSRVLDRLPKTADGSPVICDGMAITCPNGHENKLTHATGQLYCLKGECWYDGCQGDSGGGTYYQFSECRAVA